MSISTVTSEALQAKLRQLLPSQQGFGTDISASDTIIPVIDLTQAAEGSTLDPSLQQALSIDGDRFTSTSSAAGQSVSTTTGFNRCFGTVLFFEADTAAGTGATDLHLYDGTTEYDVFSTLFMPSTSVQQFNTLAFDFIYFAKSGVSLRYNGNAFAKIALTTRQIATLSGTLVNPTGITP